MGAGGGIVAQDHVSPPFSKTLHQISGPLQRAPVLRDQARWITGPSCQWQRHGMPLRINSIQDRARQLLEEDAEMPLGMARQRQRDQRPVTQKVVAFGKAGQADGFAGFHQIKAVGEVMGQKLWKKPVPQVLKA